MNRRTFLSGASALPVAAALPAVAGATPLGNIGASELASMSDAEFASFVYRSDFGNVMLSCIPREVFFGDMPLASDDADWPDDEYGCPEAA